VTVVDRTAWAPGGEDEIPGHGRLWVDVAAAERLDPIALFEAAREIDLEAALWLQPAAGFALVGIGRAWAVEAAGEGRFAGVAAAWGSLAAGLAPPSPLPRGVGPVLLGGLGFSPGRPADPAWAGFGAASLVLPRACWAATPEGAWLTQAVDRDAPSNLELGAGGDPAPSVDRLAARARALAPAPGAVAARPVGGRLEEAGSRPDRAAWDRLVGLYAGAVGRGRLDKVVLARRVELRSPIELDVPNALRRLATSAPESTVFAFSRSGRTFLGATPERLVRTEGRAFTTVALAGSIRRGADAVEDEALAAELLASEKEREEHAVVVDMLRASLSPLCESLELDRAPGVMRLRDVQHLVTQIRGRLHRRAGMLALAAVIHPTPAVGGEPRDLALELIAEHEGFERGWYAGPVGWVDAAGDGELAVALRSGLVAGTGATLFAGCGIVADSDPAQEWEESRVKLRTVAGALGRLDW
jgi:isochorismate synthase